MPAPDFEYSSSSFGAFDYDLFPVTATGSAVSNAFLSSANPFSPSGFSPAYSASGYTPPPSMHTPPPPASYEDPAPLFDTTESVLLNNFLTSMDGPSDSFLFNPVLPPGMPSPPPALLRREDVRERETLGDEVDNMRLGGRLGSPHDAGVSVKEEEVPDDSLGGYHSGVQDEADRERAGVKTRGAAGGQAGRGSGKKVKVDDSNSDVEMAGGPASDDAGESTATTSASKPRRPPRSSASARPPARRPSVARQQQQQQQRTPATSLAPTEPRASTFAPAPERTPSLSPSASESDPYTATAAAGGDKKAPLTDSQKRSNHILSEQKRRNAIRSGFKDLVDLLAAGEAASGIVVAPPEPEPTADEPADRGRKKKAKGSGRGRGRKGDAGAGASKSVVLEKAASYIRWLERGNEGLEAEVRRVERLLEDGLGR